MNMNFKTRNEARKHCWANNIPLKQIQKLSGSHPWVVSSEEIKFRVGRKYKLIDVENFSKNHSGVGINTINKLQAQQILKHLPEGVEVIGIDLGDDKVRIKTVPGLAFNTLRTWEAQFFVDVTDVKAPAKPEEAPAAPVKAKAGKAKPTSLDAELDGGKPLVENLVTSGEKDPGKFVAGRAYVLVDHAGFTGRVSANHTILKEIESVYGKDKPFTVEKYGSNSFPGKDAVSIKGCAKTINTTNVVLFGNERKYFREAGSVSSLVSAGEGVRLVNRDEEEKKQKREAAFAALKTAQENHNAAIDNLRIAATELVAAAEAVRNV